MQHCDDEVLALWALGERVDSPADAAHLELCPDCRAELDALRATVTAGRSGAGSTLLPPPPRVWDAIADELALDRTVAAPEPVDGSTPVPSTGSTGSTGSNDDDRAVVTPLAPRRARRWAVPALAAAACLAGLVAGVAGTLIVTGDDEPAAAVLARTALEPLPAKSGRGEATLAGTGADRTLRVDVTGLAAADGFYEVWVLDPKTLQMQSLGVLRGVKGDFAVPAGLDLRKLSVVDVSLEPYDGDPAHSRNSVVRGALPT